MKRQHQMVQCAVCGKVTAGKMPKGGDGTYYFPRKHYIGDNRSSTGKVCPGIFEEGSWVERI